ncbi:MAG: PQQ-binding-like beta-propeller repeat protein [Actinomycetota bacterium]
MRRALTFSIALLLVAGLPAHAFHAPYCDWPMYGHSEIRRFSIGPECGVDFLTLRPAWVVPARDSVTASPAVAFGRVYVGAWDGTFYAIDRTTGHVDWTYQIDDDHEVAFGRIVSSAAVQRVDVAGGGTVDAVVFGGGATLYALNPQTGALLAAVDVDPRTPADRASWPPDDPPEVEIESSPLVARFGGEHRIYVGMDVHNGAGVGRTGLLSFVLAPNPGGPQPYRFDLRFKFDPETQTVLHDLTAGSKQGFGCGGVWSSPMLHRPTGTIVFGTANCEHPEQSAAAGEIAREAMFAIDAATGALKWYFAPRGPNFYDDDFGATPNLLPNGAVGIAGKDGTYYARDAATGAERFTTRAGQPGHVQTQFAVGGAIGSPAVALVQDPLAGIDRHLIFMTTALSTPFGEPLDSGGNPIDQSLAEDPARMLSLHAIDAYTGEIVWRTPLSAPSYGAASVAGNVLMVPVTFGARIELFEAATGIPLDAMPTFGAPSSTPVVSAGWLYTGTGTRETDLEFKAFGNELGDAFEDAIGAHPLSPASAIMAFRSETVCPFCL